MEPTLLKEPIRIRVLSPIPHINHEGKTIYYQAGDYINVSCQEELDNVTAPQYPFRSQLDLSNVKTEEMNEGALNVTRDHKPLNIHEDVKEVEIEGIETYSINPSGQVGEVTTVQVISKEPAPSNEKQGVVHVEAQENEIDQEEDTTYLETQSRLFADSMSTLQKEFAGKYVCFEDGQVLASGSSIEEVASLVIGEGPDKTLFIEKVDEVKQKPKKQRKTERRLELAKMKALDLKDLCSSYELTYTNKSKAVKDIIAYEFGEA